MKWKGLVWIGSFAVIFLFLPSLATKIWVFLWGAPWQAKSWLFYIGMALALFFYVRWRWRKRNAVAADHPEGSLLFMAKERLVKGEITLEEFREIRRELDQPS